MAIATVLVGGNDSSWGVGSNDDTKGEEKCRKVHRGLAKLKTNK